MERSPLCSAWTAIYERVSLKVAQQTAGANQKQRRSRLVLHQWLSAVLLAGLYSIGVTTAGQAQMQSTQSILQLNLDECLAPSNQDLVIREAACVKAAKALNRTDAAEKQLLTQVELMIGDLRIWQKDFAGAKAAFERAQHQAIGNYPAYAHALFGRSLAYAKMGMHAEAKADYERALSLNSILENTYASYTD